MSKAVHEAVHVVIPDTQVCPGVRTDHLAWIGQYLVDHFKDRPNVKVIHLGDHWDMSSLSSYDRGKKAMEGRRVIADIDAGNDGFALLNAPLEKLNAGRARRGTDEWWPERHFLLGNHEQRIARAAEDDAQLDGLLSYDLLDTRGWKVHDFLVPVCLNDVVYAHYFVNQANGRPVTGLIENRIKTVGHTFVQGHQQGLKVGMVELVNGRRRGIVAGSCYLHDEEYRGPQARHEWRGILVLHEVRGGDFDVMEVSLNYLCRRYEGVPLETFLR